jgi:UDP-N-acetyl-D-glucosamine dehydrogenase
LRDAKILMVGVAFKRDVDDTRHSPAIRVMELLLDDGASHIDFTDPFVDKIKVKGRDFTAKKFDAATLQSADVVIITTDHTQYDYEFLVRNASHIIDTRNATKHIQEPELREKIVLLGSGNRHTTA